MIFESLWPLAFLLAVPVVIILYLLKPKGKDYRISSNLLWDKLLKNQESKTFLEKFIHNILMYLQIVIILLLVLALMSPYIHKQGSDQGNVILVLDTSGSMQHDAGDGSLRIEKALEQARELIASSEDTAFSIVTSDCMGADLLAVGVKDKSSLYKVLEQIVCCDGHGDLQSAESLIETLRGADEEAGVDASVPEVIVYTDGNGAEEAMRFSEYFDARVLVMGDAVRNVANNFLAYTDVDKQAEEELPVSDKVVEDSRRIRCASSLTNYSDTEASLEISLYEGKKLVEVKSLTIGSGETNFCYFQEYDWQGEALRSEISSVRFAGMEDEDSLAADNVAYAIPDQVSRMDAVLIGEGNTYIEKAYQAATGMSLTRVKSEGALTEEGKRVRIYDAGQESALQDENSLIFKGERDAAGTAERVLLTVTACDLTTGLNSFSIGVNETKVYEIPEWGTGFLWAGEQCAGYYGEHDGIKIIVVGFDIRESDFPLKAEFPIFMSNAIHYLNDTSLLADSVYMAGENVVFHPQAELDVNTLTAETGKAGLFEINAGDLTEQYVVRFATDSQSDGRLVAEGTGDLSSDRDRLVKKQLKNVLLVLILFLMAVEWFVYRRQMRSRSRFYLAVRIVGMVLLLLALLGVSVNKKSNVNTTIFLVDISSSNEQNLKSMEAYLEDAIRDMPARNQYGIVTFGKNSLVEQFLTKEDQISRIMSLPDKTATNYEEAVSRALAMIPPDSAGRIVLLTDGKETKGSIANTAAALTSGQIELLALVYEADQGKDVYVDNVELPSYLYQGDAYSMTVTVKSNYETDAELQVWMGSMLQQNYGVHLNRGENQFQFRQIVTGEEIESLEVRVVADGDTCLENDSYHAYAVVNGIPRILLVAGMREDSSQFENLLRSGNCNYQRVSAINAPSALAEMLEYDSIILDNVFIWDLPEGFLANIETYVKDYGCGLISCGGEESFALGGYRESVLETVLPVDMELRGVNEIPKTAMIMVIDHSGSMSMDAGNGATNLDLAITAAKTAVDQMRSSDYVGVVTFDDTCSWVVDPTPADNKEEIKEKIENIAEGGGTTIKPALKAALQGVTDCDANIRHVILLTDGQGETNNFRDIISAYQSEDVTMSTVAVGDGSDTRLLEQLAMSCGGRYYYSDMASDIPKIFAQEVFLSGDTYLQNGVFSLAVNRNSEITRDIFTDGWPSIYGYISATPKNTANVLIASEKDDPVLTVMQYGLGHTVAWNTDVTNKWTAGYAGESDYVQLWKRIIDYSVGNAGIGEDALDVKTAGGYTSIVYNALNYDEQTKVEAVYTDPEGNTQAVPLQATAPGCYEAKLDTDMIGIYHFSVRRMDRDTITNVVTTASAVQFSDEYKFDVNNKAFNSFMERYGAILDPEDNFWKNRKSGSREQYELAKWLILLAILWFVMDIALRRFHFQPQDTKLYHMTVRWRTQRKKESRNTLQLPAEEIMEERGKAEEPFSTNAPVKKRRKTKAASNKQEPQTLDTSALLRKKDQRTQASDADSQT